jgi:transcriptional antiterminator RfaH
MVSWYVLKTHNRAEEKANKCLIEQDFVTYFPHSVNECRHARRTYQSVQPTFPGFIFVAVDPQGTYGRRQGAKGISPFKLIPKTPGVAHFLCNRHKQPTPMPLAAIAELKSREIDGFIPTPKRPPRFSPGDQVRVGGSGIYAGLLGLYEDQTDQERYVVLLSLLGREAPLTLDAADVMAA